MEQQRFYEMVKLRQQFREVLMVIIIDAFGVTYHLVQSRLKIDFTPIIAYAVTPIRWQKRANYIGARPQQLRRAYQVQLQHPERF